jgi:hypothetical protein
MGCEGAVKVILLHGTRYAGRSLVYVGVRQHACPAAHSHILFTASLRGNSRDVTSIGPPLPLFSTSSFQA